MLVLLSLALLLGSVCASDEDPFAVTQQGVLKGTNSVSQGGRIYASFQGIPYAKPPVGKERFKEPQPAKPWKGVWIADSPSRECMQLVPPNIVIGDEDCLYLNVYTPSVNTTSPLDVLVNIHGGAFMLGTAHALGPKYLLDRDIVYVNLNYRLGILGFFSTEDAVVPGNNGLKDQVLALQWIKKNIAAFGGNPDKLTLTGTSAGGVSVHLHTLSPLSKGLFQRAITPSGTALHCWGQAEKLKQKGEKVAALLGCPTHSSKDLIECLRNRPANDLVHQVKHFSVWYSSPFSPWGPTVEISHPKAFLADQPIDLMSAGKVQAVPWLTGVTTHEGLYPAALFLACPKALKELNDKWETLAPLLLDFNYTVSLNQQKSLAEQVKRFYLGDKCISPDTTEELVQMIGDRMFVVDNERAARIQANLQLSPVYFYHFAYRGKHSLSEFISGVNTNWGSSHGDETGYVLDAFYMQTNETEEDQAMTKVMVDMWINFAKTGYPNPPGLEWSPIQPNKKEMPYLWVGNATDLQMRSTEDLGHRKFWDSLPIKEPQISSKTPHFREEL